jgi:hypothetical protein
VRARIATPWERSISTVTLQHKTVNLKPSVSLARRSLGSAPMRPVQPHRPFGKKMQGDVWFCADSMGRAARRLQIGADVNQAGGEVPFAKDDDMIKAVPPDQANQPLRISVLPWRPCRVVGRVCPLRYGAE